MVSGLSYLRRSGDQQAVFLVEGKDTKLQGIWDQESGGEVLRLRLTLRRRGRFGTSDQKPGNMKRRDTAKGRAYGIKKKVYCACGMGPNNYLRLHKIKKKVSTKEKEFAKLIKDNQGLIIKVSRLYTNALEDEEDLFQEIVLQLWRSYDTFKGGSKISTWMYRVALNTAITLFRKKTKSPQTDELMDFHHKDYVEDDEEKQQQIALLYKVIKMLPKVERAIVMMYLDDLPYRDIAENLGISEVNARVKMNRLKKRLKELMERHA